MQALEYGAARSLATFTAGFLVIMALLATARASGLEEPAADFAGRWIAFVVGQIVRLTHGNVGVDGNVISIADSALRVTEACSGFEIMAVLGAAILAYPVAWKRRLVGAAFVVPFVSALNVVRVATLILVLRHVPQAFDVCHTFVWQGLLVLCALGYWLVWLGADAGGRPNDAHA